jgi:hypothetical protein
MTFLNTLKVPKLTFNEIQEIYDKEGVKKTIG